MTKIGMCPDPFQETDWAKNANPHLVWQGNAIESVIGEKIIPLSRKQAQTPALWKELGLDIVHLHWPGAIFNFYVRRWQIQKVLPQRLVLAWAKYQLSKWEEAVKQAGIPIVWQVHDILSHHAVEYNYPADVMLHRTIFRCSDGLVFQGEGSAQPVFSFYHEEKPYAVGPLGSYRALYGEPLSKEEAKSRLGLQHVGKIFAYLGTARPKRNAAATVKAFAQIASDEDVLLIAGNSHQLYLPDTLDARIRLFDGVVPKEKFLEFVCASDFVINDGPKYLTSAIIRAVVSYHRPVIAYPYGNALDYADRCAIWIDDEKGGLQAAMKEASEMDAAVWQKLSNAAAINEEKLTWEQNGKACAALYEQLLQEKQ
jgi:beta-1,4-mannosyltransferase